MKIRRRINSSGGVAWQVDFGVVDGRRVQRNYQSKAKADAALADARAARRRHGDLAPMLSTSEAADFLVARDRLRAVGASVQEAVDYFLRHAAAVREHVTVTELARRFIDAKEDAGRAARGLQTLRCALGSLVRWMPAVMVTEVQREHVEAWLRGSGWAARTKNSRLAFASTCFRWAVSRGLCSRNPCEGIGKMREDAEEVGTLTVGECEALLRAALVGEDRWFMPYVAIGLFCGLRRSELERLTRDMVNLAERTVIVAAKKTKTRQRRVVDLPEVAVTWMRAAGFDDAWFADVSDRRRLVPSNLKDLWPGFRERAGLKRWPHNAMRHTFASMHYAMHQNENALQAIMGHRSAEELHQHYRALKTRAEAERFWGLRP